MGVVWAATTMTGEGPEPRAIGTGGRTPIATGRGGTPRPPGPAPPGKVWSPEHGHWHDAPIAPGAEPTPQPPGPAPPGKVWSPEHGHWHDAPPGAATSDTTGGLDVPAVRGAAESSEKAVRDGPPASGGAPESGSTDDGS